MLDRLSLFLFSFTTIAFIAVCFTILNKNYLLIKILFVINYAIFITSYVYTVLINPGIPKRDYYIKNKFCFKKGTYHEDFGLTPLIVFKSKVVNSINYCDTVMFKEAEV